MVKQTKISGLGDPIPELTSRIGQPQFLSQVRYDRAVRTPLLKQAIETMVARRIDATYDAGVLKSLSIILTSGMGDSIILGIILLGNLIG